MKGAMMQASPRIVFSSNSTVSGIENGATTWTCLKGAHRDDVYLFYFQNPECQIAAVGVCTSAPDPMGEINDGNEGWGVKGRRYWNCRFEMKKLNQPVSMEILRTDRGLKGWWHGKPFRGQPKYIDNAIVRKRLIEIIIRSNPSAAHLLKFDRLLKAQSGTMANRNSVTKVFDDDAKPPARIKYSAVRTVRNTPKGDDLKNRYAHRCQVCGTQILVPGGKYSEVHHLRPLGRGHRGLDNQDNMLVVCPSCHAQFDLCAIAIDPKTGYLVRFDGGPMLKRQCRFEKGHKLAGANVRYHWKRLRPARNRSE